MKNVSSYIAARVFSSRIVGKQLKSVNISVVAIALGIGVMIVTLCVSGGFQHAIRSKVMSFGNHITVNKLGYNHQVIPFERADSVEKNIRNTIGVKSLRVYSTMLAILKVNDELQGIQVKGIDSDIKSSGFNIVKHLNNPLKPSHAGILLSEKLSKKLEIDIGQRVVVYFISNTGDLRPKIFHVEAIYNTGLSEFDEQIVVTNIKHVNKKKGWLDSQIEGYEIQVDGYEDILPVAQTVYDNTGYDMDVETLFSNYSQLLDWIDFQDINLAIIITLMTLIAVINTISTFFILLLEKVKLTGILKSIGANNKMVSMVFIKGALRIVFKGLVYGNGVGLMLIFTQYYTHWFRLDEATYYLPYVPVKFLWVEIILTNLATFVICLASLVIPSRIILNIKPYEVLKLD